MRKKQIFAEVSDEFNQRLEIAAKKSEKKKAEFIRDAVREEIDQVLNVNQPAPTNFQEQICK